MTATVGVTAGRRAEEQALLLERAGLRVLIGPAMGTALLTESGPLRDVTAQLIADPPDYVVADTGIGIRSWVAAADGWGWRAELLDVLGRSRIACRGPKALGALRSADLPVWWRAPGEQLAEVRDHLLAQDLTGARVAVQLHGEDEPAFIGALQAAGAHVVEVPVYRWTVPDDRRPALDLVRRTCEGEVDALTFTSAPAVHGLFALARAAESGDALLAACNGGVLVACVGPVCGAAATEEGLTDPRWPEHWRLGSMVRLVVDELARSADRSS
jgi:uroporphyrinogen-III synthase